MPDALLNPAAVPGHNAPPLPDLLKDLTADLSARSADLLGAVERCAVQDEDTAGRAVTLASMLKAHAKKLDGLRDDQKRPFLEAGRTVDAHFKALIQPIEDATKRVVAMVDTFRREQQRKADEVRRRLEADARAKAEEAARLAAQARDVDAEIQAQKRAAEAAAAAQQAQAMSGPVRVQSDYGAMATGRKVTVVTVTDPRAFVGYLLKTKNPELADALDNIAKCLVKAKIGDLPGVTVTEDTQTVIR